MDARSAGRARLTAVISAAAWICLVVLTRPGLAVPTVTSFARSLALAGFPLFAAALCAWCAVRSEAGSFLRARWGLVGAGLAAFGLGQCIEEFYYVAWLMTQPPALSVGRGLIVAAPLLLSLAFGVAVWSYRHTVDIRRPLVTSVVVAVVLTAVGWTQLLGAALTGLVVSPKDTTLLVAYPVLLMWTVAAPLLACIMTVSQLGNSALTWPWWLTGSGVLAMLGGSFLLVQEGLYTSPWSAGPGEMALWLGCALIGVSAALEIDVQESVPAGQQRAQARA